MGRMFVGQRKGAPMAGPTATDDAQSDPEQSDEGSDSDKDVETCPNCDCQFTDSDEGEPKIVKPGKKVEGDTSGYKGMDLDSSGSDEPVPGKMGAAHDAALGDAVMAQLLGGAHTGMGRVR